jgi:outer membrane receptor for ferrienterochelin and colicins
MRGKAGLFLLVCFVLSISISAFAQATGRIAGRAVRPAGGSASGVVVTINELARTTVTDAHGSYSFENVPAGTYSLIFSAAGNAVSQAGIVVTAGRTTTINRTIDWQIALSETITVFSASRQPERIVEAPAAVSVVTEEEIAALAPTGQLPKVLETAPGVDFAQSGLYDINFNARGFNSSLNRRILTLIDGRDPAIAFLGAQEWAAVSFPLDIMEHMELVRGPGSALYGANAFNGVLNMITRAPRYDQGGRVQFTGGDLSTLRADVIHSGHLGGEWFYRAVGGYQQSDDFTRARNNPAALDYSRPCNPAMGVTAECLPVEAVPLARNENQIGFGGLRFDRHIGAHTFTAEGGYATIEGPTFQTGIGRVQVTDVERPWARLNYNMPRVNFLAYYDARKAVDQVALSSGAMLFEDSSNIRGEVQTNWGLFGDRVRLVAGGSVGRQEVDTSNRAGVHTLMDSSRRTDMQALFGQLDTNLTENLRFVVAARWDDSDLHTARVSPKGSLVYGLTRNQSVRLSYNEAFQVPNYSEFFLQAPAGLPVNLSAIEQGFAPFLGGVPLHFGQIPLLARGNPALDVEEIRSVDIGYSGIFANRIFLTLDYYQNRIENFVTDLLPGVNPLYPAYQVPPGVHPQVAAQIMATLQANLPASLRAGMTTLPNGRPAFVFSYTNAGVVDTSGIEFGVNYYLNNRWLLDFNYSWFDFDIVRATVPGDQLFPNAPEHKANAGITYRQQRWDAGLKYRWVDGFYWAAGVFQGSVPSYDVVNLTANYRISDRVAVGTVVSNVLDSNHWESFGGDRLARRALGFVTIGW